MHKNEGFFFKNIYTVSYSGEDIMPIVLTLGSNALSAIFVIALCSIISILIVKVFLRRYLVKSKVQEIIGFDVCHIFAQGDRILQNYFYSVITEYYPEEKGEVAIKKQRLMTGGNSDGGYSGQVKSAGSNINL
jgi:hypothetical protein